MTNTEVAAELDALVAAKVMGWFRMYHINGHGGGPCGYHFQLPDGTWKNGEPTIADRIPLFSTTYEGMGLVLERMRELPYWCEIEIGPNDVDGVEVIYRAAAGWSRGGATGRTLPEAVARAALDVIEAV